MAGVNFSGISSGLDTDLIIQSLLAPRQTRVDNIRDQISTGDSEKKALNSVKSALTRFESAVGDLTDRKSVV